MRKLFSLLTACMLLFVLSACGDKDSNTTLNNAEFMVETVTSGSGKDIGTRGYVEIAKEALKATTNEEFLKFCEDKVKDSGHNWVTIICDDGTGLLFTASMSELVGYGNVNEYGQMIKSYGFAMLKDGIYEYQAKEENQ